MSDYTDIQAAILARLNTVSNIGKTYDHARYAADLPNFLTLFSASISGSTLIRGWWLELEKILPAEPDRYGAVRRNYVFIIHGIHGMQDTQSDTEETFENMIETVMDALDVSKDYSLTNVIDYSVGPSQARLIDYRTFGTALCHHCEIELSVEVQKAVAYV